MSQIKLGGNHCLPYLKFSSWVQFLFSHNLWHHLCGLEQPNESMCKKVWSQFWDRYKKIHPTHPVFHRGLDMSRVCALILHGDEGRTAKKSAILIVSLHSILGYGLRTATNARNDIHKLNYKASTWVTRFLLGVLPKSLYQYDAGLSDEEGGSEDENDEDDIDGDVVESLLQFISNDLAMLYNDGFINPFTGEKHYFVVLNIAGDWPWLQKSGHLTRTFMNAAKHKGSVSGTGICHMTDPAMNGKTLSKMYPHGCHPSILKVHLGKNQLCYQYPMMVEISLSFGRGICFTPIILGVPRHSSLLP